MCGQGVRGIRILKEVILLLFFGACKYVCATWESQCWSKLNAEFLYFIPFLFITLLFVGKKSLTPVVWFLSVGSSVQPV